MMDLGELKPVLSALVLPPAGPLLLAAAGLLLTWKFRRTGLVLVAVGLAAIWTLSCNAVAIALSLALLQPASPLTPAVLKSKPVQAVVILGGGVVPNSPEYGRAQPSGITASRIDYGVWLARSAQLPIGFAGGVGWGAAGSGAVTEGEVARQMVLDRYGMTLRWVDDQSRDTEQNARLLARLMHRDGARRVALVTDSWHMPRAIKAFERAGFAVVPAPTGFPSARQNALLEWVPSVHGLGLSRAVLREWLALQVARVPG